MQEWTVIKLVGPAAFDAAVRFDCWWKAREGGDSEEWCVTKWSEAIRHEASAYLESLIEHRREMPIVYFSQHVDLWTMGGGILGRSARGIEPEVMHATGELWCHRLPDEGKLLRLHRSAAIAKPGQYVQESQWLARRLLEAAEAYDQVWPEAVLLLNRRVFNLSLSDEELRSAAATLPVWLAAIPDRDPDRPDR
jgi:hypothetical protein